MLGNYLKDNGHDLVLTNYYLEIYVPETYFESKIANIQGSSLKSFGILNCRLFDSKMKPIFTEIINLPTIIYLNIKDIEQQTITLYNFQEPTKYRVLKYYKGDSVMPSATQKDGSNVELFAKLLLGGKLDDTIPYNKLMDIWEKNLQLNQSRLDVPLVILSIIISEIYRNKNNPNEKFAKLIGKNPNASQNDYKTANAREICARNSVFGALTFEDMDSMITSSLNMKNYNKKQIESPIEKIIKM